MDTNASAVSVADILPFFRYAVGPTNGLNPAIPFYRIASAEQFFDVAKRELPWCGCIIYKRTRRGLVTVREYVPPANAALGCPQLRSKRTRRECC